MPRSKFHRQYLYVSDAQYLASNIDLSEHYEKCTRRNRFDHRLCQHQQILEEDEEEMLTSGLQQLDDCSSGQRHLSQNIRFVMGAQLEGAVAAAAAGVAKPGGPLEGRHNYHSEGEDELELAAAARVAAAGEGGGSESGTQRSAAKLNRMLTRTTSADCSEASAIGSSSDSGVFASSGESSSSSSSSSTTESNSSSASSSSSGSSLTIDMVSTPRSGQSKSSRSPSTMSSGSSSTSSSSQSNDKNSSKNGIDNNKNNKCSCNSLYENKLDELAMIHDQQRNGCSINGTMQNHNHMAQLVGGAIQKPVVKLQQRQFKREHFEFGQCALDWYLDSHEHYHRNKSVALISAGMTTGSDKKYVTDTVQTLHKLGYEVCVFIRRGVGGLKLNSTKFFSPSKWHDFETAILSIKKQRPDCRLVAIGFSFGSIELCRYLSMSGQRSLVDSALLISCPFDPEAGGRNMRKRALNRKIDAYLAKNLGKQLYQALSFDDSTSDSASSSDNERTIIESMEEGDSGLQGDSASSKSSTSSSKSGRGKHYRAGSASGIQLGAAAVTTNNNTATTTVNKPLVHENYNGSVVDLSSLPKIKSLVDFEDNYNRVIQHYPNSDAYGADSRLNEQLGQIKTPTLCLSSEDDFMAPYKLLPIKQIEANENLCMILTKRGGHMAFIDGLLWPRRPYFAQRIIEEYMKLTPKVNKNNNTHNHQDDDDD